MVGALVASCGENVGKFRLCRPYIPKRCNLTFANTYRDFNGKVFHFYFRPQGVYYLTDFFVVAIFALICQWPHYKHSDKEPLRSLITHYFLK